MPPVLAATLRGIPTLMHEQNAVIGRANRLLAPRVDGDRDGLSGMLARVEPALQTRSPHRQSGAAGGDRGGGDALSRARRDGTLRLLVFGGSQGARIMSDVVPAAIERLRRRSARAA